LPVGLTGAPEQVDQRIRFLPERADAIRGGQRRNMQEDAGRTLHIRDTVFLNKFLLLYHTNDEICSRYRRVRRTAKKTDRPAVSGQKSKDCERRVRASVFDDRDGPNGGRFGY
jgi:hypothetical protein